MIPVMVDMWRETCLEKWRSVERKRLSEGKLCRNRLVIHLPALDASHPERRHSNSFLVAVQSLLPVKTSVCKQNPSNFYFWCLSLIVGSWELNFVSMPSDKCKTFILCTTTVIIALLLCDLCIYNIKQSTWKKNAIKDFYQWKVRIKTGFLWSSTLLPQLHWTCHTSFPLGTEFAIFEFPLPKPQRCWVLFQHLVLCTRSLGRHGLIKPCSSSTTLSAKCNVIQYFIPYCYPIITTLTQQPPARPW